MADLLQSSAPSSSGVESPKGLRKGKGKGGAPGRGRGKGGTPGGKGAGGGREGPRYEASSPCGYYVAGHCRYGAACSMQHSIDFTLAIRSEWLQPEDPAAKDVLRAAAEQCLGAAGVRAADLFPRAFSRALRAPAAPAAPKAERHSGSAARRWSRARETCHGAEDQEEDGFAWEQEQEERTAPSAPAAALAASGPPGSGQRLRYLLILDLEGKDEIIEFPVIAVDAQALQEVGRFQRFVRPRRLFDGCAQTPGSPAVPFPAVLEDFGQWLHQTLGHGLDDMGSEQSATAFLTCGDWDCKHVHTQCGICGIPVPPAFRRWVNIKRSYSEAYGGVFRGMKSMLARLKLLDRDGNVLHGFHHLGMHDVENIGRCVLHLLREQEEVQVNGWMRR